MSVAHSFVAAYRGLLRRPLSMSGIVITLTLGVAISVTMFSVLHGVVLGALPYPDSDRIVTIYRENPEQGRRGALTTAEASEALVEVPGFESTAYYTWDVYTLRGDGGPRIVTAVHVSGDYFAVFGAPMALGRALNQSDVAENRPVVVLSHAAWLELTGGDPNAVGRTLSFDRGVYELVGVLPENFGHPLRGYLMYRPMYPLEGGRGSQT
jgi:putative ABC transport system permease protein